MDYDWTSTWECVSFLFHIQSFKEQFAKLSKTCMLTVFWVSHIFVPVLSQELDFQRHMSLYCLCSVSSVTIKDFVDINGFDNHHCLNFLFINDVDRIEWCDIRLLWCLIAHQNHMWTTFIRPRTIIAQLVQTQLAPPTLLCTCIQMY